MTNNVQKNKRAVLVLGMHRSGTSALTRVINLLGIDLGGNFLRLADDNPRGFWEHAEAVAIDDQLLLDLGRSWHDTRALPEGWLETPVAIAAGKRIATLINRDFNGSPLWAVKDPRLCRLAPLWIKAIELLGYDVCALFAMRHPAEVARSLLARDGLSPVVAESIWLQHFVEAEYATRGLRRNLVMYSDLLSDWRSAMSSVAVGLGLDWPKDIASVAPAVDGFLNREHRHHVVEAGDGFFSDFSRALYTQCAALAHGEVGDWAGISKLVDAYRSIAPTFLGNIAQCVNERDQLAESLRASEAMIRDKDASISDFQGVIQENERKIYGLLETVHGKDIHIQSREEVIRTKDVEIHTRDGIARDMERELGLRDETIRNKDTEIRFREELIQRLEARVDLLAQNKHVADGLARQLDQKQSELRQREDQLQGELQAKSAVVDELARQLSQKQDELKQREDQLQGELQAKEALADEQARRVDEKQIELQQMERKHKDMAEELRTKDAQADELSGKLDRMRVDLQRQENLSREVTEQLGARDTRIEELNHQMSGLRDALVECEAQLKRLEASLSWRMTAPFRSCNAFRRRLTVAPRRVISAVKHVFQDASSRQKYATIAKQLGPFDTLRHATQFLRRGGPSPEPGQLRGRPVFDLRNIGSKSVVVLSTMHCRYVAELIVSALERSGIAAHAIYGIPENGYDDVPHFVICPQMFERLPGFYVSFQMEQSVSTRWFTPEYLHKLENSFAIFDYSLENIEKLVSMGLYAKQFYYLPVGYLPGYAPSTANVEKKYDVLFYGDINNERRRACIAELEKVCRVKVISNLFGAAMIDELQQARVVVNIHYYAGALLESTRLWECLSLGCLVVSERSSDMDQHEELHSLVDFVDEGDFVGMAAQVQHWLGDEPARRTKVEDIATQVASMFNRFEYFFYRFLLATGNLSFERFWQLIGSAYPLPSNKLCLNLPEYTDRAASFDKDNRYGFHRFPGLRHSKGWMGCALSYKYMIRLAKEQGLPEISICEDDVEFPADFDAVWVKVSSYLATTAGQWHIFSGLIADLHEDAKVLNVNRHAGYEFVITDKMTSTVFNVYDQTSYDIIDNWNETNEDVVTNTIDRYLERNKSLRVMTTCPFLVGHKEDLYSTLWGGQNTVYRSYISKSEALMREKVDSWYSRHNRWRKRVPTASNGH